MKSDLMFNTLATISYLEIREKPGVFWLTYQLNSSLADCTRQLFKLSKDSASLWVCNEKQFLVLAFVFFEWRHK